MTPHHHWIRNYCPHIVPIRLADASVVYSVGVSTVVYPLINGKRAKSVEFSNVLHVPNLGCNLLSVLYLTTQNRFSVGGRRITFIDEFTKLKVIYVLRLKSDVFEAFNHYKAYMENLTGERILALQDDKGREYMSNAWDSFCFEHGISRRQRAIGHSRMVSQSGPIGQSWRPSLLCSQSCICRLFSGVRLWPLMCTCGIDSGRRL